MTPPSMISAGMGTTGVGAVSGSNNFPPSGAVLPEGAVAARVAVGVTDSTGGGV